MKSILSSLLVVESLVLLIFATGHALDGLPIPVMASCMVMFLWIIAAAALKTAPIVSVAALALALAPALFIVLITGEYAWVGFTALTIPFAVKAEYDHAA